jgi:hypothetical protein
VFVCVQNKVDLVEEIDALDQVHARPLSPSLMKCPAVGRNLALCYLSGYLALYSEEAKE